MSEVIFDPCVRAVAELALVPSSWLDPRGPAPAAIAAALALLCAVAVLRGGLERSAGSRTRG